MVRLIHPSFQDFLTDATRCTDLSFSITHPNCVITTVCADRLLQFVDQGHNAIELLRRKKEYNACEQKVKGALHYASYYFGDHLRRFSVDQLEQAKETVILAILVDRRLAYLIHASDLSRWANEILLEFLTVLIPFCTSLKIDDCMLYSRPHCRPSSCPAYILLLWC